MVYSEKSDMIFFTTSAVRRVLTIADEHVQFQFLSVARGVGFPFRRFSIFPSFIDTTLAPRMRCRFGRNLATIDAKTGFFSSFVSLLSIGSPRSVVLGTNFGLGFVFSLSAFLSFCSSHIDLVF